MSASIALPALLTTFNPGIAARTGAKPKLVPGCYPALLDLPTVVIMCFDRAAGVLVPTTFGQVTRS